MGWKNELFPHLPDDENPRVFLDMAVGPTPVGRVVIILKADKAPKTCENFRCMCTGEKGTDSKGNKLHFKGSSFHRVVPDFLLQGGDCVHRAGDPENGAGQTSIYQSAENPEGFFDCEYNSLRHAGPGVVSIANQGPNTNGSQFMIELRAHPFFDHLHTVFGVLYEGLPVLRVIEQYGTAMSGGDSGGEPTQIVTIIPCGELHPGVPEPLEPPEAAAAKLKRQQDRANYDSRNPPILHSVDINRAKLMPNASSEYVASLLYQPPQVVENLRRAARKKKKKAKRLKNVTCSRGDNGETAPESTDDESSDEEAAADRFLAAWPIGTLATDAERKKMGMAPMDPQERRERQAEVDKDPEVQGEIKRPEDAGHRVHGRAAPVKKNKQKKRARKVQQRPAVREFSPTSQDVADADAALARMEAQLTAKTGLSPEERRAATPARKGDLDSLKKALAAQRAGLSPEEQRAATPAAGGRGAAHAPLAPASASDPAPAPAPMEAAAEPAPAPAPMEAEPTVAEPVAEPVPPLLEPAAEPAAHAAIEPAATPAADAAPTPPKGAPAPEPMEAEPTAEPIAAEPRTEPAKLAEPALKPVSPPAPEPTEIPTEAEPTPMDAEPTVAELSPAAEQLAAELAAEPTTERATIAVEPTAAESDSILEAERRVLAAAIVEVVDTARVVDAAPAPAPMEVEPTSAMAAEPTAAPASAAAEPMAELAALAEPTELVAELAAEPKALVPAPAPVAAAVEVVVEPVPAFAPMEADPVPALAASLAEPVPEPAAEPVPAPAPMEAEPTVAEPVPAPAASLAEPVPEPAAEPIPAPAPMEAEPTPAPAPAEQPPAIELIVEPAVEPLAAAEPMPQLPEPAVEPAAETVVTEPVAAEPPAAALTALVASSVLAAPPASPLADATNAAPRSPSTGSTKAAPPRASDASLGDKSAATTAVATPEAA